MRQISDDEREDYRLQEKEERGETRAPANRFPIQELGEDDVEDDEVSADIELTHPASRAVHALNNCLQIMGGLIDDDLPQMPTWMRDVVDARRLVESALPDIAALQQYIDRQEENLRTMAEESNETHRLLTAEREKNTALNIQLNGANKAMAEKEREVEELAKDLYTLNGLASAALTKARGLRLYDDVPSIPQITTSLEALRLAAGGA